MSTFETPALRSLPVPFNHYGRPLEEENYRMLWQCGRHLVKGLQAYHWHAMRPGDFLCSLLANDLAQCVQRADPASMAMLKELIWYVHNEMPSTLHGSWEVVDRHAPKEKQ